MLNQNFINTFQNAGLSDDWEGDYPGWPNVVAVLATSHQCKDFVEASLRSPLPVYLARCLVDAELFRPTQKTKSIAFMPRRRYRDVEAVVQLLHRRPALADWELVPLHGMSQADVAAALARASIFMSFADREGFGLPAAEAMAAGCYVVGFTGLGGREFMSPETCSIMDGKDLVEFVNEVERTAKRFAQSDPTLHSSVDLARSTISTTYTRSRLSDDLDRAFSALTSAESPALQRAPSIVRHFSTATFRQRVRERVRPMVPRRVASMLSRQDEDLPPTK